VHFKGDEPVTLHFVGKPRVLSASEASRVMTTTSDAVYRSPDGWWCSSGSTFLEPIRCEKGQVNDGG
jgi:hypothetical protein